MNPYRIGLIPTKNKHFIIFFFRANEELDTIEAKKDLELTRAYAEIRLLKTKNESLENQLNLKKDENEELIKICDQLMGSK